jgi:hypothetical protein
MYVRTILLFSLFSVWNEFTTRHGLVVALRGLKASRTITFTTYTLFYYFVHFLGSLRNYPTVVYHH